MEQFWADVVSELSLIVPQRNLERAIKVAKGQILIKDILCQALPMLPDDFDERMDAIYHLYHLYGHGDWAKGLAGHVESLKHYGTTDGFGVPGAV